MLLVTYLTDILATQISTYHSYQHFIAINLSNIMSSNPAANNQATSASQSRRTQFSTQPHQAQQNNLSNQDAASEITTFSTEKNTSSQQESSKSEKMKKWAKNAKQWTIFGDSKNPGQEQGAFYR